MKKFLVYMREYLWRARIKTCLCVFPLRAGLFCLASLNIFISLMQLAGVATGNDFFLPVVARVQSAAYAEEDHSPAVVVLPPAALLAFSSVLIAALFRKDVVLLGVYCCCVLGSLFLALVVYGFLNQIINALDFFLIIIDAIYQIYILILVRSLMIEIELENTGQKSSFLYNKDQGVVIIRDVESPPPGFAGQYPALPEPRSPNGLPVGNYPALTEPPGINTSVTTLETLHERPEYDSRFNTINRNTQSNTLRSYTVQEPIDNTQRSATLPHKDTNALKHQQKIGAVQSLAGPATFKTVGSTYKTPVTTTASQVIHVKSDTLNKEDKPAMVTTTAVIETNTKITSKHGDDEITKDTSVRNEDEIKTEDVQKKKGGFFSKAPKEVKQEKNVDKTSQSDTTSKPSTSKATDGSNTDGTEKDKTEEAPQKKKRGLFKKSDKKEKVKKSKGDKSKESQDEEKVKEDKSEKKDE